MQSGEIFRDAAFYVDPSTREPRTKYLLILATPQSNDIIFRLLTSKQYGRPRQPPCYHGNPYSSFYLGVLGGALSTESWLDLRYQDDLDVEAANRGVAKGKFTCVHQLDPKVLIAAIECAAGAQDTTHRQEKHLRDQLAVLRT